MNNHNARESPLEPSESMPKNRTNPLAKYASDFGAFVADLHVPLGASAGKLGEHTADFQQADFNALAGSLHSLARGEVPPCRRFWIERTKGGSKDSDVAVAMLWLLAFSPRSLRIQVGAYDREQASEVRLIVKAILAIDAPLNRILREVVEVQSNRIVAHARTAGREESTCEILTTDAFGSHGARPDVVICDELSHVGSEGFMQTLLDNADKVPHSLVIIATNAGELGTWQERWRDIARDSDRWHYSLLDRPAPWVSEEDLAESRLRNPTHRYNRLWHGVWSTGEGDSLSVADIEACTSLELPPYVDGIDPLSEVAFGAFDLGVKRDHSGLVVLVANTIERKVRLARVTGWRPQDFAGGEVDLATVEHAVRDAQERFSVRSWFFDPWQALLLGQNLRRSGINAQEWPFTSTNKDEMARSLLEAFRNRELELYPNEELQRDLLRLRIKEAMHGGFRLDAVKDENGHADRAIAMAIALPFALHVAREWSPANLAREPEPVFST